MATPKCILYPRFATILKLTFQCVTNELYTPDHVSSEFYVFEQLKEAFLGKHFQSDKEVKTAVHEWIQE